MLTWQPAHVKTCCHIDLRKSAHAFNMIYRIKSKLAITVTYLRQDMLRAYLRHTMLSWWPAYVKTCFNQLHIFERVLHWSKSRLWCRILTCPGAKLLRCRLRLFLDTPFRWVTLPAESACARTANQLRPLPVLRYSTPAVWLTEKCCVHTTRKFVCLFVCTFVWLLLLFFYQQIFKLNFICLILKMLKCVYCWDVQSSKRRR